MFPYIYEAEAITYLLQGTDVHSLAKNTPTLAIIDKGGYLQHHYFMPKLKSKNLTYSNFLKGIEAGKKAVVSPRPMSTKSQNEYKRVSQEKVGNALEGMGLKPLKSFPQMRDEFLSKLPKSTPNKVMNIRKITQDALNKRKRK